ncbi:MAG: pyruvate kinase [Sedimentisphaerales bacterium]|nr:pyruvate kinase [Sedimentisphaerales bacterium]MBN2813109.1 pyruvate kinase [Bacteroidales bacterium]
MKQSFSKTKIVATLGPASSSKDILRRMIYEGVDVFRINFSHSKKEEYLKLVNLIKELNIELDTHVAILADLQGPKLRIGEIENNLLELVSGDVVTFVTEKCIGNINRIYMSYLEFPQDVNAGETILIDDGKIKLEVTETNKKDTVKAKVIFGGPLSSHKGVNLPHTWVSLPCLTDEDISNAIFALNYDVDWIALSFVRKAADVLELKELIKKNNSYAGVIAKIEKPDALEEIDQIIEQADGIMVARGDLGVEMPFNEVPLIQKQIIEKCNRQAKPVIVATQMMESMITNFTPTRAEATDVTNAVLDGADALMLSGETSIGKFPVETILNMQKIIFYTEAYGNPFNKNNSPIEGTSAFLADSICHHASILAKEVNAKAIITFTHSGYTAFHISSHRPKTDIFAFTSNMKVLQYLAVAWGVRVLYLHTYEQLEDAIVESIRILKEKNLLTEGDCVIHVGSLPLNELGKTNILKINIVQ